MDSPNSRWVKITKARALELMGDHSDEIRNGEKCMKAEGFRDSSYCIPSTGKNIWAHRNGCVFTYKIEQEA